MPGVYKESFKKTEPENIELAIYNCGQQSCGTGYTWGPGVRDHYLIHLVTAGRGSYTVNGHCHAVGPGELFLAKPSQLISYSADINDPWEYHWVGFNGAGAARLVQQMPFAEEAPTHRCIDAEQARHLLQQIYLARGTTPGDETRMVGYLYLFIALLAAQCEGDERHPPETGSQYVHNAVKYIQFNYSNDIGVDDIAKAVGVSRSHLYRVFIKNVGKSPIDYLTGFRIGEACNLLENSHLSVAEIAYSVGFFDQFYFSRVFKKVKGVPPSQYLAGRLPSPTP